MMQRINMPVWRKLQKQILSDVVKPSDFIAQRSAQNLFEQSELFEKTQSSDTRGKGLLLFEGQITTLAGATDNTVQFDQLPLSEIAQPIARMRAMLSSEQYQSVLSNLAFDWVDAAAYIQFLDHLLAPHGRFWFSAYGPRTAAYSREILRNIDQYPHFNEFYDVQDIGDALLGYGFKDVVLESVLLNLEYRSVEVLLADAENIFGVNSNPKRRKGLTPARVLEEFRQRVAQVIEEQGKFTEQVELLFAHGHKAVVPGMKGSIPVAQPG